MIYPHFFLGYAALRVIVQSVFATVALAACVFFGSGCSSEPKAAALETRLNEELEKLLTLTGARHAPPVSFENLTLETTIQEAEARIRFQGDAVLDSEFYQTEQLPAAVAKRLGDAMNDVEAARVAAQALSPRYQAQVSALNERYSLRLPSYYVLKRKKGERLGIKGKATATKFGDAWEYGIESGEFKLVLAQINNELKGLLPGNLLPEYHLIGGSGQIEKLDLQFKDSAKSYANGVAALLEEQEQALAAIKEKARLAVSQGALYVGSAPYGNAFVPFAVEVAEFDEATLSGDVLIRNRSPWSAPRRGVIKMSLDPVSGIAVSLSSTRNSSVPGADSVAGAPVDLNWQLHLVDSVLEGTSSKGTYRIALADRDEVLKAREEIAQSEKDRAAEQAEQEAEVQRFLAKLQTGREYVGDVISTRGDSFEVLMAIDSYDVDTGLIKASVQEARSPETKREYQGIVDLKADRAAMPTLSLNSTQSQSAPNGTAGFLNSRQPMALVFKSTDYGLEGSFGIWRVVLKPLTEEAKAVRKAVEEERAKRLLAYTEPGTRFGGTMRSAQNALSGDLVFQITDRSADATAFTASFIDPKTGGTRVYLGQIGYVSPLSDEVAINIKVNQSKISGNGLGSQFDFIANRLQWGYAFTFTSTDPSVIRVAKPTAYWVGEFKRIDGELEGRDRVDVSAQARGNPPAPQPVAPYSAQPKSAASAAASPATYEPVPASAPPPESKETRPTRTGAYYFHEGAWEMLPFIKIAGVNSLRSLPGIDGAGPIIELEGDKASVVLPPDAEVLIVAPSYDVSLVPAKRNNRNARVFGLNRLLGKNGMRNIWTVAEANSIFCERYQVGDGVEIARSPSPLPVGDYVIYFEEGRLEHSELGFEFRVDSTELSGETHIDSSMVGSNRRAVGNAQKAAGTSGEDFAGSVWFARSIALDPNLPIDPGVRAFWEKGTYLFLREDHSIGFNSDLVDGPYHYLPGQTWTQDQDLLEFAFGDVRYRFFISPDQSVFETTFSGVLQMTIRRR